MNKILHSLSKVMNTKHRQIYILSPTFRRALLVDSTIDKLYINTKDQQPIDAESFTDFLKLVNFQQIKFESTKIQAYIKIYKLLLLNCLYKTLNLKRI